MLLLFCALFYLIVCYLYACYLYFIWCHFHFCLPTQTNTQYRFNSFSLSGNRDRACVGGGYREPKEREKESAGAWIIFAGKFSVRSHQNSLSPLHPYLNEVRVFFYLCVRMRVCACNFIKSYCCCFTWWPPAARRSLPYSVLHNKNTNSSTRWSFLCNDSMHIITCSCFHFRISRRDSLLNYI